MRINDTCDGGKELKLQAFLLIVMLTLLIQSWVACSEDKNGKILQFNPRLALSSDAFTEDSLGQFILPDDIIAPNSEQISVGIPSMGEINQDLKAILQVPLVGSDISSAIGDSNQDDWKRQMESGFNQILEMRVESNELGGLSSGFSTNQGIANDVNSNLISLMDNGESGDISWGMDLDSPKLASYGAGGVNDITPSS
jgi:hypothetical protein